MDKIARDNPTIGLTFREETGCGSSFFSIKFNWKEKVELVEVFCGSSSKGGCTSNVKMMGRLVSTMIQHGVPLESVVDQLESEICPTARYRAGQDEVFRKTGNFSCSKALASAIKKTIRVREFFEIHQDEIRALLSDCKIQNPIILPLPSSKTDSRSVETSPLEVTDEKDILELREESEDLNLSKIRSDGRGYFSAEESRSLKVNPLFKNEDEALEQNKCPECASSLQRSEGCLVCRNCGYSKC